MSFKDHIFNIFSTILGLSTLFLTALTMVGQKRLKIGLVLFVFLCAFFLMALISKQKKEKQKKWQVVILVLAIVISLGIILCDFVKTDPYIYLSDETFEMSDVDRALLYDDTTKEFPIWFKEDIQYNHLRFMVDNIGTSFADLKHAQFIVDDYKPITSKEVLLLKGQRKGLVRTGVPPTVKAVIDLSNIANGKSKYDFDFFEYKDNETDIEIRLRDGQSFNIDPTSQTELILYPKFNKSGIYTYHLKIDSVYNKTEYTIETEPVSFIYIAEDSNNYEYDDTKLDVLNLECDYYNEELDRYMHYTINGRTLLIHDTEIIFSKNDLERYLPFINTIVIEEGTKRIEAFAFGKTPDPEASVSLYLPLSLEYLDTHSFDGINIEKQFYSGTEDQLDSILQSSDREEDGEKRTGYEGK